MNMRFSAFIVSKWRRIKALRYIIYYFSLIKQIIMPTSFQKEPWRGSSKCSLHEFCLLQFIIESLFNICGSPKTCCFAACCPECVFGQNAANVNDGSCLGYCCIYMILLPIGLCGLVHKPIRVKIREKYNLQEEPSDCLAAYLLSPCAICQEAREIESRGQSSNTRVKTMQPLNSTISNADSEVTGESEASET